MKEPDSQAKPLHQPQHRSTCEHIDLLDEKHILEPKQKSKRKLYASDSMTNVHFSGSVSYTHLTLPTILLV